MSAADESRVGMVCINPQLTAKAQPVVDALRRAQLLVVTAESCTGGLIAAILSHGIQASDCLHGGFVAYTKAKKTARRASLEGLGLSSAATCRRVRHRACRSRSPATP
jgi:nicotinamide-nucleotide amidase